MSEARSKATRSVEGETRRKIMLHVLKEGPVTASDIGTQLGLSAAGVRRHLDILVDEGLAETVKRRPVTTQQGRRHRGRPAKLFRLTENGRAQFGHAYDDLASDALTAIKQAGGSEAVRKFARARLEKLFADYEPSDNAADDESVEDAARDLAETLDAQGFATTVSHAGHGVQICQHHCPLAHVAAKHPELCEAEQEMFANLLGTHVQPLASIADGHGICTTNIPLTSAIHRTTQTESTHERSGS